MRKDSKTILLADRIHDFRTYFILSGENEHLAVGELRALLDVYDPSSQTECFTKICVSTTGVQIGERVASRAAFVKEYGSLRGVMNIYDLNTENIDREVVGSRAHVSIFKNTVSREIVKEILSRIGVEESYGAEVKLRLMVTDGLLLIGEKIRAFNPRDRHRVTLMKQFRRSIELTPGIARALVNLTRAKENSVLLDPFAGTGSVLLEAWSMGIRGIGVDIDWELVKGMLTNTAIARANAIVIAGDSRCLTYREIRHIATDLPYGRGASTHGVEIKSLYHDFITKMNEYLSDDGYASFMAPLGLEEYIDELLSMYNFRLIGRYYDYVHGSLVRVISVVRKW